jgi:hypothetical protein
VTAGPAEPSEQESKQVSTGFIFDFDRNVFRQIFHHGTISSDNDMRKMKKTKIYRTAIHETLGFNGAKKPFKIVL